ncbi:MAG TPA: plastocyanin/azurin family copper-binding protein [Candidatus Nitrosocosmicus sp.]|nr:plastocyanin/azurin family copper-binding protein [Candidatus Nitrosocosmicus sp.]
MTNKSTLSNLTIGFGIVTSMVLMLFLLFLNGNPAQNNDIYVFATIQQPQQQQDNKTTEIAAGGGNNSAPFTMYIPDKVEINAGQTVNWYNPTEVAEPHTVTFVIDNSTMADVVSPLSVSNTTGFSALPPNSNNEPIIIPGQNGTNTVIAVNARTFNPAVIDSSGNVEFMNPNANYTMDGTEKYVNSGWFLPKGMEQLTPGAGNTFSVTFEKPGTYNYLCILHPWMTGTIVVR